MTRVSGADHVLLLLRQRLSGATPAKADRTGRAKIGTAAPQPMERVRALAALDGLGEDERRRAVVQGLLTEEFGDGIGNDAAFQTMLDDVMRAIVEMPDGQALIDRAAAALKAG